MILKSARVSKYKSITDSGLIEFDDRVTCLVGKNESGKTAVLEALYRLSPIPMGHPHQFQGLRDYPRRTYNRDRDSVPTTTPIETTFLLEPRDIAMVEEQFGTGALACNSVTAKKSYENKRTWQVDYQDRKLIDHLVADAGVDPGLAADAASLDDLVTKLKTLEDPPEAVKAFLTKIGERDVHGEIRNLLTNAVPQFLYFDEYSIMPGRVSIAKLQSTKEDKLDPGERTALSLLRLAAVEAAEFNEAQYEARKASLEAAANQLASIRK